MVTLHQYLKGARVTKKYKSHTPAFRGNPQKKGTVLRLDIIKPKKPNSAKRKVVKVRLRNGREILAYIPGIGHNVQKHSDVLVRGGRVPDLPGVRYHIFRHKADFTMSESFPRRARRSKYGTKLPKLIPEEDLGNV